MLNGLLLLPALASLFSRPSASPTTKKPKPTGKDPVKDANKDDPLPHKPSITMYRGSMMVITCAAILAVDFKIFPRRFAKVENWGTSLMDLGVGSFVFSAGVVSARSVLKSQISGNRPSLLTRLGQAGKSSIALLTLGLIRLLSVKGVDYAEHVTEYGVHWNFFFTLGFLPPFVALFQSLFSVIPSYPVLALLLGSIYEILLDYTTLTAYIITAPRANIISQNREGIFSFIGYLAIFLAGQGAGVHALPRESTESRSIKTKTPSEEKSFVQKLKALINTASGKLLISGLTYIALFTFVTSYEGLNLRVSRRLANLPYILWVAAFNSIQLVLCIQTEKLFFPTLFKSQNSSEERERTKAATSRILYAFNRNSLVIFLLANLLTGAVNLALPTLTMRTTGAMAVLVGYIALLAGVAVGLDLYDIDLKI